MYKLNCTQKQFYYFNFLFQSLASSRKIKGSSLFIKSVHFRSHFKKFKFRLKRILWRKRYNKFYINFNPFRFDKFKNYQLSGWSRILRKSKLFKHLWQNRNRKVILNKLTQNLIQDARVSWSPRYQLFKSLSFPIQKLPLKFEFVRDESNMCHLSPSSNELVHQFNLSWWGRAYLREVVNKIYNRRRAPVLHQHLNPWNYSDYEKRLNDYNLHGLQFLRKPTFPDRKFEIFDYRVDIKKKNKKY